MATIETTLKEAREFMLADRRCTLKMLADGRSFEDGHWPHWLQPGLSQESARVMLAVSEELDVDPNMLRVDIADGAEPGTIGVWWCGGAAVDDLVRLQERLGASVMVNFAGGEEVFPEPALELHWSGQ